MKQKCILCTFFIGITDKGKNILIFCGIEAVQNTSWSINLLTCRYTRKVGSVMNLADFFISLNILLIRKRAKDVRYLLTGWKYKMANFSSFANNLAGDAFPGGDLL